MTTPYIIAHRGASAYARENTLEAFEKAIQLQADMIELDVHKTADDVLAIYHDAQIDDKELAELTYQQLQEIAHSKGFSVPTLDDACALAAGKIRLNIEIKGALGCEKPVIETAQRYFRLDEFIISSVFLPVLENLADLNPAVSLGLVLFEDEKRASFLKWCAPKKPYDTLLDFLSVPYSVLLEDGTLSVPHSAKPLYVWTVNDADTVKQLSQHTIIHGVFTDVPDTARAVFV